MEENEDILIYEVKDFEKIKEIPTYKYMGYVYAIDCGDVVKIGQTSNPYKRMTDLKKILERYGDFKIRRIGFSKPHTNYRTNETVIHKIYANRRVEGTELFRVKFLDVMIKIATELKYEDRSEEMEIEDEIACDHLKNLIFGKTDKDYNFDSMDYSEARIIVEYASEYMCAKDDFLEYLERYRGKDIKAHKENRDYANAESGGDNEQNSIALRKICTELTATTEEFEKAKALQRSALEMLAQASILLSKVENKLNNANLIKQSCFSKSETVQEREWQSKKG
jgi:hypothetical protein